MQTEHAVCWGAEFPLAGEAEVAWVLWQVPSHTDHLILWRYCTCKFHLGDYLA